MRASSNIALVLSFLLGACLPTDDRPVPGKAELRVVTDPGSDDFETDDGWRVRYDEAFAAIGNVRLESLQDGAECEQYASTPYLRIVDLLDESTRLATLFARGPCALRFQIEGPRDNPAASEVDEAVVEAMRTRKDDPFVREQSVVLRVAGHAERDGEHVRFAWAFRQSFDYDPCTTASLAAGESELIEVRARLHALFADPIDARVRFDGFAKADADADGEITLDELAQNDRALSQHLYFVAVPQLFWIGDQPPCFVGMITHIE
jgi:hypothetical protein